jgi:hypothetical protein
MDRFRFSSPGRPTLQCIAVIVIERMQEALECKKRGESVEHYEWMYLTASEESDYQRFEDMDAKFDPLGLLMPDGEKWFYMTDTGSEEAAKAICDDISRQHERRLVV